MKKDELKQKPYTPTIVSLFSGCGGLDLGFVQEGYKVIWANDNDSSSCKTYKRNFGDHIVEGDIAKVDLHKLPKADIIFGGFPCQDFSMIWKRGGINTSDVIFVRALSDQVITESEYSKITDIQPIKYVEVDGNHDFEGEARKDLNKLVKRAFI